MTVLEGIKKFVEYNIGDFVVTNGVLYQITQLPCFEYTIRYTDGDWDTYMVQNFEEVASHNWDILGYGLKYLRDDGFAYTRHHLFVEYELYDEKVHSKLISSYKKFQLLSDLDELDNEIDEMDE